VTSGCVNELNLQDLNLNLGLADLASNDDDDDKPALRLR